MGRLDVVRFLLEKSTGVSQLHLDVLLCCAAKNNNSDLCRYLICHGANIDPMHHNSPLYYASENGHIEVVDVLLDCGASIDPSKRKVGKDDVFYLDHQYLIDDLCPRDSRCQSPLAAAIRQGHYSVASLLLSKGAVLMPGEEFVEEYSEAAMKACPAITAIRAQERQIMGRRLLAHVSRSRQRILDAGLGQSTSANLAGYAAELGTCSSIWRKGTRAIRDISDGYLPGGLSDVISALQVANAMRSSVRSSKLAYSKKEFIKDLPRWASLLKPNDRSLFTDIVSCLWDCSTLADWSECPDLAPCAETLSFFQELVHNLVGSLPLFQKGSEPSPSSFRLESLRQCHPSLPVSTSGPTERVSLSDWDPIDPPEAVQEKPLTDPLKPPDAAEEYLSVLGRITVIMAGAIFGVILLYMCLHRHGFSMSFPLIPSSDLEQSWGPDQICARNCFILAAYLGTPFHLGSWETFDQLVAKLALASTPNRADRFDGKVKLPTDVSQSLEDSNGVILGYSRTSNQDSIMDDAPTDEAPAAALASPQATALTNTHTPSQKIESYQISTHPAEQGTITCEFCGAEFKLGKMGRRGQRTNLQKHKRNQHPEQVSGYKRVMYRCRHGCGYAEPAKSNVSNHEEKHCALQKGKNPRRNRKWS